MWKNTRKVAEFGAAIPAERVVPIVPTDTKGFVKCQCDPNGCPNRATHWLQVDKQCVGLACHTHVAWYTRDKAVKAEKFK